VLIVVEEPGVGVTLGVTLAGPARGDRDLFSTA
jgi:hypothetical protein